jgi:predicted 3-demethylubiquinone-9 3-methyltransferase (glyoxalase superfamily)
MVFELTGSSGWRRPDSLDRQGDAGVYIDRRRSLPFLWFDHQAEEEAQFYTSVFPNSRVTGVSRYGESGPGPKGTVMTVEFELDGQRFIGLNGGPHFQFTEAVSFVVNCETQQEVDEYWEKLTAGGREVECGWLKDRYGLSWQIVPAAFLEVIKDTDAARKERGMKAMMKMDIAHLEAAYRG